MGAQGAAQHRRHPGVALDDRGRRVVRAAHLDVRHQVVDRGLGDLELAEGGQHLLDVVQERRVGPDDEGAGAGEPLAVGVEQVRDTVQADGRLPGAGAALDAHRAAESAADDLVLLGLDGGDDVAHRAHARALDLLLEQLARGGRLGRVGEVLVLVRGEVAAGVAEAAPQPDVHRVLLGGPVERLRDRGAPVDDHGVAVRVVDVPPPDVERLALRALGPLGAVGVPPLERSRERGSVQVVEPAEEQRGVAQVREGLDALVDLTGEDLGVDPVRRDVADVEGLDVGAHGAQGGAGRGEVPAFAGQRVEGVGGAEGVVGQGGHGDCLRRTCWSVSRPVSVRTAALHEWEAGGASAGGRRGRHRSRDSRGAGQAGANRFSCGSPCAVRRSRATGRTFGPGESLGEP